MTRPYLLFKRLMDVAVAAVLLVVLSPLIVFSLVIQWIEIGSSPIFFQERPGRNEKVFKIFKLKTMNEKRGADGELLTSSTIPLVLFFVHPRLMSFTIIKYT